MNILELDSYNLADTVKFHDRLNPRLWDSGEHLRPEVKDKLMQVAQDFQEFLGVPDLDVKDITISGSNAAFNYTPGSDIDLHIVIDIPDVAHDEVYRELFNAKKYQYNDEHDIRIRGADVELYAQDSRQPHHSQGIYSLLRNSWLSVPKRNRAEIDDVSARSKFEDLAARIDDTVKTHNVGRMDSLIKKIKTMRQTGLEQQGEFGSDNIAFKLLRNNGYITRLWDAKQKARDLELSLAELHRPKQPVVYGFGNAEIDEASLADMRAAFQSELKPLADPDKEKVYRSRDEYLQAEKLKAKQQEIAKALVPVKHKPWSGGVYESPDGVDPTTKMFLEEPAMESPDGVNPTTAMFLTEVDTESVVQKFIQHTAERLGIRHIPEIIIHHDPDWSKSNHSFGMYVPDQHKLHVSLGDRHLLDVLRTTAHELCHCAQHESAPLPDNAGDTGSSWENEANAVAGIVMRDFANSHPEYFQQDAIKESASGYIPTKAQARDPRYSMALTVDIKPGQVGKEANKLNLKTDKQGKPGLLMKTANLQESLAEEFELFESQDLFEINMGSKNLRKEAAKTGAIAGMEFEMIVPNVENTDDDGDQEPDYEYDQRCRSIQDAYDFFYDGDWNSRRSCDEMRNKMQEDFQEWIDEKLSTDWDNQGEEYTYQWVKENVDESEWNPEEKSDLERTEALEEFAANVHADPMSDYYQSAYEEFREENEGARDESDWLDDADLDHMSAIENAYSMEWPHWSSPQGGEANIEDVAQEFENAIGRDVRASDNYHSGSTLRPSVANQRYVVEPDGSLEPDDPNDRGLEFVSPPLPIDEILSDLNKVKAWAGEYGCYTNDSTGLHINISVPDYSREKLDFVKLALLMGDKYVLDLFGRSSNTYAKSALDIVKKAVRENPADAAKLLDKMKGNMDQLATKAIHSGSTSKYTSINTKDGHIEFRSPGGDWLNQNFDKIENTLLRFTVAMSAALNPDMYRQEYLTKLYKLLSENNKGDDTIKYFSDYVAGKIPQAALRSFVKQAQLQRNIKRGKFDGQKMWWKVYKNGKNAGQYGYTVEVVATSEEEAKQKAAKEWGEPLLVNTLSQMDAEALRPYVEQPDKPGAQPSSTGTYELFDRRTGEAIPGNEFTARNQAEMNTRLDDYINFGPHGIGTVDARLVFGVRPMSSVGQQQNWRIVNSSNGEILNTVRGASREQAEAIQLNTARRNGINFSQLILQSVPADDIADSDDADQGPSANSLRPTGPGPWEIYNRATGNSVMNLDHNGQPMADRGTAQRYAIDSLDPSQHERYGVRTRGTGSRDNIGTQTDMENRLGLPSQSATANYAVVDRQTLDPVFRFQAGNRRDANGIYGEWLAAAGLPSTTENYGFQEIRPGEPEEAESSLWAVRRISDDNSQPMGPTLTIRARDEQAARDQVRRDYPEYEFAWLDVQPAEANAVPEVPMDVAQNFPDRTDGRNIDYSFRDLFGNTDQASSAPAGNSFSGQWRVMIDGEEVWRFRGVGNSQIDANRIAQTWLQDQRSQRLLSPAPGADIEVVPVMIEGIEESFSQGVVEEFLGEYPSIETTLGEATHPDLVKYDKNFQKQLHRDLDVGQGKGKKIDIDYHSDEKDWSDLTHIQDYTGGSVDTNDYLHRQYRNKAKVKELTTHQAKIQALDRILANHKLPQQIVVYTGLRQSPAEAWETYGADVTKPIRLHLPAYTSTTTKLKVALIHAGEGEIAQVSRARHKPRNKDAPADEWGTQILMMTLPAGLPAASVKKISEFPRENEILLPRGMDIEINPRPTVLKGGDFVWHATVLSHSPVQIAPPMQENFADADESLTEIAAMPANQFAGGKDMLDYMPPPSKKRLKPLPGGTDLMYAIETMGPETRVQIVDPGMPGITRPVVVAVLNLDPSSLPNTVQVGSITVDEDYRGRGLAKALYGIVLTIMKKTLISGSSQTPGGRRNWLSLASIPGVEVKGLVAVSNRDTDTTVGDPKSRYNKYVEKTIDRVMELGGQFVSRNKNFNYWAFDVEPSNGQLQPVVRNALSKLYGYDSDALLMATWTGV